MYGWYYVELRILATFSTADLHMEGGYDQSLRHLPPRKTPSPEPQDSDGAKGKQGLILGPALLSSQDCL